MTQTGHDIVGETEWQITHLKPIKRRVHGRAKLDLLQARLFGAT